MKKQVDLRYAKVDVLINYWDKIISQLTIKSRKFKDEEANKFVIKILKVKKDVRFACLSKWI